jgi:membrane protease YdiL (CAAX protease family)
MVAIGSAGVLAPGKWRWLRALGWMAALCVGIVIGYNAVAKAVLWLLTLHHQAHPADRLLAAIAGSAAILLLYAAAVRWGERRTVSELDLRPAPRELLVGMVTGGAAIAAVIAIQWFAGWVVIGPRNVDAVALALRDSIRSGVLEELALRVVIFRLLWRAFGIWPALFMAATIFGLLHLGNPGSDWFAALCLIAGEGIGIALYLITGRIWAPIGMHAAWNFTQGWIFGAVVSGVTEIAGGPLTLKPAAQVPDLLTGGGFGPEASLAALLVSLAASAAFLRWAWIRGDFKPRQESVAARSEEGRDLRAAEQRNAA